MSLVDIEPSPPSLTQSLTYYMSNV